MRKDMSKARRRKKDDPEEEKMLKPDKRMFKRREKMRTAPPDCWHPAPKVGAFISL